MKLCHYQKTIIVLLLPIIVGIVAFCRGYSNFLETLLATIFGEVFVVALAYWLFRQPILDIRKLVDEYRKLQDNREHLKSINDFVFNKWKNIFFESDNFNIEIRFKEEIDSDLLNQGREFLKSKNDETKKILETWNLLKSTKDKYNETGEKVKNRIEKHLSETYPSLKRLEAKFVNPHRKNCYVIDNIIGFVIFYLIPVFLKKKDVDWSKILHIYPTIPPKDYAGIWELAGNGTLIQSKNNSHVNKKRFQKVMEKLKPKILSDLEQLDNLDLDMKQRTKEFKEKMNRLSNLIDLSMISD